MDERATGGMDRGGSRAAMPEGTFAPCGAVPRTARARIDSSELMAAAALLGPGFEQTVRLFCWATGAAGQADVTDAEIERFCDMMRFVGPRFGTHAAHFDREVETVVANGEKKGGSPRDRKTIMRHRNRLPKITAVRLPRFQDRVEDGNLVRVTDMEKTRIAGWADHRGFLLVERHGEIRQGIVLETFDRMMDPRCSATALAPPLIHEAQQKRVAMEELGRAVVATRHGDHLRLIPGFWQATASP